MRFFSNEAQDNVDDKTDRPADPDTTAPLPQQRAGSPWQHDTDPASPSTAADTSTVGDTPAGTVRPDDDPDRTHRIPGSADPTVAFSDEVTRDRGIDGDHDTAPKHKLPDDTAPKHKLPDDGEPDRNEPVVGEHLKDTPDKGDPDEVHPDRDEPVSGEERKDDATVDAALDDRGTFDDPHLTHEAEADSRPEVTPVAATPAGTGPLPFFPSADTQPLRDRWRDVQLRFVDDPKGATTDAAGLVDEAVDKLSQALRDHRGSVAKGTDDTESLRVELRGYRDILDRLLGL
jgi:hypothetical protein